MQPFRFSKVYLEAMAVNLPETELSSVEIEDKLAPLYQRLGIPFGTFEKISGVRNRRLWKRDVMPSAMSTKAAEMVLDQVSLPREKIGAVFNCSVTRDYFEPATACLVHRKLGLPESTMAMDITNACIGFSNGLLMMSGLIESGVIKAGLLTSAETVTPIIESTIGLLQKADTMTRDELLKVLPTLTLGCGSVSYLLCHESIATSGHRLVGGIARSATDHSDLCSGNADYQLANNEQTQALMYTESAKLMASAAKLGGRMFKDFSQAFEWTRESVDHVFCHQVGKQVNDGFYKEMGLDLSKEFTIYRDLGNMVSAALPAAVAIGTKEKNIKSGEKVLMTAFGSGLNSIFWGLNW